MAMPLQIFDPHFHLWDLSTGIYPHFEKPSKGRNGSNAAICRTYGLEEYLGEGEDEFEIVGAVHVEAFPTDPIKESETIQRIADNSPVPILLVGNADLTAPGFAALLDRHATFPSFRGIRQVVNRHADAGLNYVGRAFMDDPAFLTGLRLLGQRGLSFDLQLYPHQMAQAAALAAKAPATRFILNHAGMWADRDLNGWMAYKQGMRTLASQPNVVAKISGIGMLDPKWTVESMRPIVFETIEAFGTKRSMFASNFPVDKLTSDYPSVWRAFAAIASGFSEAEQAALFRDNARSIYRFAENA
jgi:predicted TIM-barrel fold metal-dependent hydrolase